MAARRLRRDCHEDVDLVTVLVDGPPEIQLPSLDVHEKLVQIPRIAHSGASAPERPRVDGTKPPTPLSDGFVGDGDAALGEQILHIAEAEAEAVIQPDGVTDDFGRESIAVVVGRLASHPSTLPATSQLDNTG